MSTVTKFQLFFRYSGYKMAPIQLSLSIREFRNISKLPAFNAESKCEKNIIFTEKLDASVQ